MKMYALFSLNVKITSLIAWLTRTASFCEQKTVILQLKHWRMNYFHFSYVIKSLCLLLSCSMYIMTLPNGKKNVKFKSSIDLALYNVTVYNLLLYVHQLLLIFNLFLRLTA